MGRPRGYRLNRFAFDDVVRAKRTTGAEVAEMAGMPKQTVSGLRTGSQRASMKTVRRLANALNCHPETLFPELLVGTNELAA